MYTFTFILRYGKPAPPQALILEAPLDPNRNDKGTAFAGSIYAATVQYTAPVWGPFTARCTAPPPESWEPFMERVRSGKNARIELTVELLQESRQEDAFRRESTPAFPGGPFQSRLFLVGLVEGVYNTHRSLS